jgi:hypothetical protein
VNADFDPRCDGPFVDAVLGYLIGHVGERVRLTVVFNADPWSVRDAVDVGRHHGLIITAHQGRAGYTLQPLFARPTSRHEPRRPPA